MSSSIKKYKNLLPAAALAVLVAAGSPAVVFAEGGTSSGSGTGGSSATSGTSGGDTKTTTTSTTGSHDSVSSAEVSHTTTESSTEMHTTSEPTDSTTSDSSGHERQKAESQVKKMREEHKSENTAEQRQKACESRKHGLETKFTSIATNSDRYLTRINEISAKAQAFQAANSGTNAQFASQLSAMALAQTNASNAVEALKTVSTTPVDCANANVATDVATFKENAANARTELKVYKMAVKDYLKALKTLKTSNDTASNGSTSNAKPEVKGTN